MPPVSRVIERVYGKAESYIDVMPGDAGGVLLTPGSKPVVLDPEGVEALARALATAADRADKERRA